ncbi:hypothetical protein BpHYR1_049217 [Brachionus plicatilis]|uniref:Uncharacterized protein n=1 Tax=Brachionus plicatilis TaxID=10195 RepID=A0A3M7RX55_BRAPC|nr:hypothetical protein BpHYR1_049217 [Brachionus plicatilis]
MSTVPNLCDQLQNLRDQICIRRFYWGQSHFFVKKLPFLLRIKIIFDFNKKILCDQKNFYKNHFGDETQFYGFKKKATFTLMLFGTSHDRFLLNTSKIKNERKICQILLIMLKTSPLARVPPWTPFIHKEFGANKFKFRPNFFHHFIILIFNNGKLDTMHSK